MFGYNLYKLDFVNPLLYSSISFFDKVLITFAPYSALSSPYKRSSKIRFPINQFLLSKDTLTET